METSPLATPAVCNPKLFVCLTLEDLTPQSGSVPFIGNAWPSVKRLGILNYANSDASN